MCCKIRNPEICKRTTARILLNKQNILDSHSWIWWKAYRPFCNYKILGNLINFYFYAHSASIENAHSITTDLVSLYLPFFLITSQTCHKYTSLNRCMYFYGHITIIQLRSLHVIKTVSQKTYTYIKPSTTHRTNYSSVRTPTPTSANQPVTWTPHALKLGLRLARSVTSSYYVKAQNCQHWKLLSYENTVK